MYKTRGFNLKTMKLKIIFSLITLVLIFQMAAPASATLSPRYADGYGPGKADVLSGDWKAPYSTTYRMANCAWSNSYCSWGSYHYKINYDHFYSIMTNGIGVSIGRTDVYVWVMWADSSQAVVVFEVRMNPSATNLVNGLKFFADIPSAYLNLEGIMDYTPETSGYSSSHSVGFSPGSLGYSYSFGTSSTKVIVDSTSYNNEFGQGSYDTLKLRYFQGLGASWGAIYKYWAGFLIKTNNKRIDLTINIDTDYIGSAGNFGSYQKLKVISSYEAPSGGGGGGCTNNCPV